MVDITDKWNDYARNVLPDIASEHRWVCELAFLAGAQAMTRVLVDNVERGEDEIERQQLIIARRSNEILSD